MEEFYKFSISKGFKKNETFWFCIITFIIDYNSLLLGWINFRWGLNRYIKTWKVFFICTKKVPPTSNAGLQYTDSFMNTRAKYTLKHQRTDIGRPANSSLPEDRRRGFLGAFPPGNPSTLFFSHIGGWGDAGLRVARRVMSVVVGLGLDGGDGRSGPS